MLSAFTTDRPCERKANRPPGEQARAEAARLLADLGPEVVVDLARYAELATTTATVVVAAPAVTAAVTDATGVTR